MKSLIITLESKKEALKDYISMAEFDIRSKTLTLNDAINKLKNIAVNNDIRISKKAIKSFLEAEIEDMTVKFKE
jgi:hypothetical protein